MKLQMPARFVDKRHTAVVTEIEADLEDGMVRVAIRLCFHGIMFEMSRVAKDGTLIYHQHVPRNSITK